MIDIPFRFTGRFWGETPITDCTHYRVTGDLERHDANAASLYYGWDGFMLHMSIVVIIELASEIPKVQKVNHIKLYCQHVIYQNLIRTKWIHFQFYIFKMLFITQYV